MANTKKSTEVATKPNTDLAFAQETVPSYIKQDSNRGSEEVKQSDMVLPRLEIVQSQSPIKEANEDARDGMLFNTVTQEVLGDHVYFVPIYFRMEYLVWKDQDQGGGFFGSFNNQKDAEDRKAQAVAEGENPEHIEIVDTPVQYGIHVLESGEIEQIVISMAKTKSKVSRKWNAMIQIAGGDRFSRVYKITTFRDENKKGQKFFNFVVQPAGYTPERVYREAEKMYDVLKTQDFRVAHETVFEADGSNHPSASDRGEL
jgi:hypothetical protein